MWKRLKRAWTVYRHVSALRGLLQWTGGWKYVIVVCDFFASAALAEWTKVTAYLPAPIVVLIGIFGFAGFLMVAGFALAFWRAGGSGSYDALVAPRLPSAMGIKTAAESRAGFLSSPDGKLEAIITHHADGGSKGLFFQVTNDGRANLTEYRAFITDARTLDRKGVPRDPFGFMPTQIEAADLLLAGHKSKGAWLVRIIGNHLEVGNQVDTRLPWPTGDNRDREAWLLGSQCENKGSSNYGTSQFYSNGSGAVKK